MEKTHSVGPLEMIRFRFKQSGVQIYEARVEMVRTGDGCELKGEGSGHSDHEAVFAAISKALGIAPPQCQMTMGSDRDGAYANVTIQSGERSVQGEYAEKGIPICTALGIAFLRAWFKWVGPEEETVSPSGTSS